VVLPDAEVGIGDMGDFHFRNLRSGNELGDSNRSGSFRIRNRRPRA
jgi:hypothetical protein